MAVLLVAFIIIIIIIIIGTVTQLDILSWTVMHEKLLFIFFSIHDRF